MLEEACIPITSDVDIVSARQKARQLAAEVGFPPTDLALIATAVSELARNIVSYAKRGEIRLKAIENSEKNSNRHRGLVLVAYDEGPGISNIRQALQDGFSTSGSLGIGLPGVKRLMDEFEISSVVGQGTTVTVRKWLR